MKIYTFEPSYTYGSYKIRVVDSTLKGALRRAQKVVMRHFYPDMKVGEIYEDISGPPRGCMTADAMQSECWNMYNNMNLVSTKDSRAKTKSIRWSHCKY